ncbi:hypothetical protein MSAN_02271400 [Mycena sanguinolenta]|uniref:Uncharacterized protein n=1 Tax=Mycena sanguinolenta TaxID=230812 RepID=A0A8H6XAS4_9AGAR|nr:hypothetical protein MSAN_02271400 [Mycena sanguinolenta]
MHHRPGYTDASKKNDTRNFWPGLFYDYWRLFPWRMPLTEDPPPGCEPPPEDAEAAFKALDCDLTPEEEALKTKIQTETKQKIKHWFNRQRPGHMGIQGNPFFHQLKQMRQKNDEPAPKRLADYQYYLQHPDHKDAVEARFQEECGDEPRKKHLALRCKLAREMLAAETEDVRTRLKEECEKAHQTELAAWKEADKGWPSANPEVQKQCREQFLPIIAPLLEGLRAYTGFTINIVAARVNGETFDVSSANAGVVQGKDWAQYDPVGYAEMLLRFLRFVHAEHLEATGQSLSATPMPAVPTSTSTAAIATPAATAAPMTAAATTASSPTISAAAIGANMKCMSPAGDDAPTGPDIDMTFAPPLPAAPRDALMGPPPLPALVNDEVDQALLSGFLLPTAPPRTEDLAAPPATAAPAPTPATLATIPAAPAPAAIPPAPTVPAPTPMGSGLPAPSALEAGMVRMWALEALVPEEQALGVRQMNITLHAEVMAMPPGTRGPYVRRLARMPSIELNRENSMARNRAWQADMGLSSAVAFVGMKTKRSAKDDKGRQKKKPRNDEDDWDDDDGEDEDNDSDESDREEIARAATPRVTRSQAKSSKPGVSGWAETGKKMLLTGIEGEEWAALVGLWYKLEEQSGFISPNKPHPTALRLKEVGVWVKNARKGTPSVSTNTFPKEWTNWWTAINPGWRRVEGQLVRQENEGDFAVLRCPGPNGFLSVLTCLKWWRVTLETESSEWREAVADVCWVLERMVEYVFYLLNICMYTADTPDPAVPARRGAPVRARARGRGAEPRGIAKSAGDARSARADASLVRKVGLKALVGTLEEPAAPPGTMEPSPNPETSGSEAGGAPAATGDAASLMGMEMDGNGNEGVAANDSNGTKVVG